MMITSDLIALLALIVAGLSFPIAIFSWIEARKANKNALHSAKTGFDASISSARDKLRQIIMAISDLTNDDEIRGIVYNEIKEEVQEEYLNAVNQACNAYIAKKVDKKAFLREYKNQIRQVYYDEDKTFQELLENKESYSAIHEFVKREKIPPLEKPATPNNV